MAPDFDRSECFAPWLESGIVFSILLASAVLGGGRAAEWLSATAVFLSFLCTQAAFDLADIAEAGSVRATAPGRRYRLIYLTKEVFWILACLAIRNYPLIASTAVFATYPWWRRAVRHRLMVKASSRLAIVPSAA